MERRTGIAIAGAISLVLVAGGLAVGANLGLLGAGTKAGPAGKLRPADLSPQVVAVEVTPTPSPGSGDDVPDHVIDVPSPSDDHGDDAEVENPDDPNEHETENETEHSPEPVHREDGSREDD